MLTKHFDEGDQSLVILPEIGFLSEESVKIGKRDWNIRGVRHRVGRSILAVIPDKIGRC